MVEKQARYPKLGKILNLIIKMQSRYSGITLKDIQNELEVSRRSAERLRDVLIWELPQIEELEIDGREKHWGFARSANLREIIAFSKEEIAELENIKNGIKLCNQKEILENVIDKLKVLSKKNSAQIEDEIEFLLKTEGFAIMQKPSYKIDATLLDTIRYAIKNKRRIKCKYDNKDKILSPYGIIYGENTYLVAVEGNWTEPFVYRLCKIANFEITEEKFERGDFDIKEFSERSFGIYQNERIKVKLLFSEEVADDVLHFNFHPTQKVKQNKDGTVLVEFKASGDYEILWHLFRWGENVKIVAPKSLKNEYVEMLKKVLDVQS